VALPDLSGLPPAPEEGLKLGIAEAMAKASEVVAELHGRWAGQVDHGELEGAKPGPPARVVIDDGTGDDYYLMSLWRAGKVRALLSISSSSGRFLGLHSTGSEGVLPQAEGLGPAPWRSPDAPPSEPIPNLSWRPISASLSPSLPFVIRTEGSDRFIERIDGVTLPLREEEWNIGLGTGLGDESDAGTEPDFKGLGQLDSTPGAKES
jgi:hypothetical protein